MQSILKSRSNMIVNSRFYSIIPKRMDPKMMAGAIPRRSIEQALVRNLWAVFLIVAVGCAGKVRQWGPTNPQPVPAPVYVFVGGEFRQPGRFPWTNGITAAGAIHLAGGFTDFAGRSLEIRHTDGSGECYRLTSKLRLKQDVFFRPGDQVTSPKWAF
jgi:hypothetical protein